MATTGQEDKLFDDAVDEIWRSFGRRLPRATVQVVAAEVAERFADAAVRSYLPIFIRRLTWERLTKENAKSLDLDLDSGASPSSGRATS